LGIHGTLVEVGGVGVLLLGPSGIGKSECALELVRRGHRLVADDVVEVRVDASGEPMGSATPRLGHHVEIRGLGILSVPDLFGERAVLDAVRIELGCRLQRYDLQPHGYDRVGLKRPTLELAGAAVPYVTLPAHPTGTLATLVEVAARDQELRASGVNAAARFDAQLRREMRDS
jgi:HPr kinase/phosphorylase